jgi:hypothetical protein
MGWGFKPADQLFMSTSDAWVILRVPSQQFEGLVQSLRGLGTLRSESIGAQDVTKEYADLETRLAVKEQTVTRLRALLTGDLLIARAAPLLYLNRPHFSWGVRQLLRCQ